MLGQVLNEESIPTNFRIGGILHRDKIITILGEADLLGKIEVLCT